MTVFDFLITYSMDLETALTFAHGHFNQVVYGVNTAHFYNNPLLFHLSFPA